MIGGNKMDKSQQQIQDFIETFFGPEYMSDADEPIPLLKGYEHAFIGIGRQQYGDPIAIYDGEKCKESHEGIMRLVKESMDDALDRYEGTFKTNNETMQYDNLNEAFVGMGYMPNVQPLVIYDSDKCIEALTKQFTEDNKLTQRLGTDDAPYENDPYEDAVEWFSFNTEGTYCGTGTPVLARIFDPKERY